MFTSHKIQDHLPTFFSKDQSYLSDPSLRMGLACLSFASFLPLNDLFAGEWPVGARKDPRQRPFQHSLIDQRLWKHNRPHKKGRQSIAAGCQTFYPQVPDCWLEIWLLADTCLSPYFDLHNIYRRHLVVPSPSQMNLDYEALGSAW